MITFKLILSMIYCSCLDPNNPLCLLVDISRSCLRYSGIQLSYSCCCDVACQRQCSCQRWRKATFTQRLGYQQECLLKSPCKNCEWQKKKKKKKKKGMTSVKYVNVRWQIWNGIHIVGQITVKTASLYKLYQNDWYCNL